MMARPFLITPVIKVKALWTAAIVLISWSALCRGQGPRVDCSDGRGDLILVFPNSDFPGFNANNIRLAYQHYVTEDCNPRTLTHPNFKGTLDYYILIPHDKCNTTSYRAVINNVPQTCYENEVEYIEYVISAHTFQDRVFPVVCCKDINITFPLIIKRGKLVKSSDFQVLPQVQEKTSNK